MNDATPRTAFSLTEIIECFDCLSDEMTCYVNTETFGIEYEHTDFYFSSFDEDGIDFEGPEWLCVPQRQSRDDWRIMRDYAYALGGNEGDCLLDAIQGKGAFRAFRYQTDRLDLVDSWHAYKNMRRYEQATEWLDSQGLPWVDDRHENFKRDWRTLLPEHLRNKIELSVLDEAMSVCKLGNAPKSLPDGSICFLARTNEEISLVCETTHAPASYIAREDGWRALKVKGPLDFQLVGILAKIASALGQAQIPLFAVSTYDTDYVLVKEEQLPDAIAALRHANCIVND